MAIAEDRETANLNTSNLLLLSLAYSVIDSSYYYYYFSFSDFNTAAFAGGLSLESE